MKITSLCVGPIGTNCYILCDEAAKACAVIDPGDEAGRVAAAVGRTGCTPALILLTHGHYDHTGGVPDLVRTYPEARVYIHRADYQDVDARLFPLQASGVPAAHYDEGDTLSLGSLELQVLHTPGHSAGSVTLRCGDVLFCGDTLFAGSCGRTDLQGGSMRQMLSSLRRLGQLEGDLRVLPGHMEDSTLEAERHRNPFLMQALGTL